MARQTYASPPKKRVLGPLSTTIATGTGAFGTWEIWMGAQQDDRYDELQGSFSAFNYNDWGTHRDGAIGSMGHLARHQTAVSHGVDLLRKKIQDSDTYLATSERENLEQGERVLRFFLTKPGGPLYEEDPTHETNSCSYALQSISDIHRHLSVGRARNLEATVLSGAMTLACVGILLRQAYTKFQWRRKKNKMSL